MKTIEAYILLRGNEFPSKAIKGEYTFVMTDEETALRLQQGDERVSRCTITIDPKYLEKESDDK